MTADDELLTAWAAATDPATDPVGAAEVRDAAADGPDLPVPGADRTASRRRPAAWALAVAAAVVLVAGAAAVVVVVRDDPDPTVATSDATTTGVDQTSAGPGRLLVTNVADEGLLVYREGGVGFTEVRDPDGELVASTVGWAVTDRTILDRELPAGTYQLASTERACGPAGCGPLDDDGVAVDPTALGDPPDLATDPTTCAVHVTVTAGRTTAVQLRRDASVDPDATGPERCGLTVGTPTRLVLVAGRLPIATEEGLRHRYEAVDAAGDVAAEGSFSEGTTSLVLDRPVALGPLTVRWEAFDCPASCPTVGPDGRPVSGAAPLDGLTCQATVDVADPATDLVVRIGDPDAEPDPGTTGGEITCEAEAVDELPPLTEPSDWTLRRPLPPTCGDAGLHAQAVLLDLGIDPTSGALACFLQQHGARAPVELATSEVLADGTIGHVVWRTRAGQLTVWRRPGAGSLSWTAQNCDLAAAPAPDLVLPTGCGAPSTLSLDPP